MAEVPLFDKNTTVYDNYITSYRFQDGECTSFNRVDVGNLGTAYTGGNGTLFIRVELPGKTRAEGFSEVAFRFDNAYWMPHKDKSSDEAVGSNNWRIDDSEGLFKFAISTFKDPTSCTSYDQIISNITSGTSAYNCVVTDVDNTEGYAKLRSCDGNTATDVFEKVSLSPPLYGNTQYYLWLYLDLNEVDNPDSYFKLFSMKGYGSTSPFSLYMDGAAICTVTFNANGGTPSSSKTELTCGSSYGTLPTVTRTGYTFNGWYTAATGGTKVTSSSTVPSQTTQTLYAHWTPIQYEVKYNGNGSTSGDMSNSTHTYDEPKNLTANKFNRSYTVTYNYNGGDSSNTTATAKAIFNGWAKSAEGTKEYDDEASVINLRTTAGTFNLYANWTLSSVTLPTPTRTGYTFKGWATSSTATSGSTGSYTPTEDITLYAVWKANTYIVTFNAKGGTPETQSKSIAYDSNYILPSTDPTRTGYKFNGWWTKTDGGSQVTSNTKLETASNHILYAHWIENIARIAYKPNSGGEKVTDETLDESGYIVRDGTPYIQEVSYKSKIRTFTLEELGIDWPGHTFRGWAVTRSGTIVRILDAGREYGSTVFSHNLDDTLDTSNTEEVKCHLWAIWEDFGGYVNISAQTENGLEWKKHTVNICTQTEDGLVWKQYIPYISNGENWNRYDG